MKFFTELDFKLINESLNPNQSVRYMLADVANFKLLRNSNVVYQYDKGPWLQTKTKTFNNEDKAPDNCALLLCVEPVEKPECLHPSVSIKISFTEGWNDLPGAKLPVFRCEHYLCGVCNQRVEPIKWGVSE